MKILLDRADAALKVRLAKMRRGERSGNGNGNGKVEKGMEGLVEEMAGVGMGMGVDRKGFAGGVAAAGGGGGDEWEVLQHEAGGEEDEVAIRVDQYLVVFMKFAATVCPTVEYDYTMGL